MVTANYWIFLPWDSYIELLLICKFIIKQDLSIKPVTVENVHSLLCKHIKAL